MQFIFHLFFLNIDSVWLNFGRFGQQIGNTWKVLKCGAGEGWKRSVGPIMWEMKKCYLESMNLHEIRKRKANWIGHILRRNCLLKQVIDGKIKGEIEVTRRRGRRRKKLLDNLKDRRGYSHLKEEALDRTMWRNRFRGGFGPVVKQNTEWMNEWMNELCTGILISHFFSTLNQLSFSVGHTEQSVVNDASDHLHYEIKHKPELIFLSNFIFQVAVFV